MRKFFAALAGATLFFFSSCTQVVEYVAVAGGVFEDSGTKVNEAQYFAGGKKTSDWLLVMYMDADNKLESAIRTDFNEVEYGLSLIRNAGGTSADGYASVRVVVLWDGYTNAQSTRIFELGADSSASNFLASSATMNIQNFMNFIDKSDGRLVDMSAFNSKEVNMGDGKTLTAFLKWVDNHYAAAKGKILHVADHGSGPGNKETRSMCVDSSNNKAVISSKEFSEALSNAGYGYMKKKFSALLLDVCLGASLEDAYEFNTYADYMIASPNSTPGTGFDYGEVMKCFNSSFGEKKLSEQIGRSFRQSYENDSTWGNGPTITVIDLSKINDCVLKIDALADSIKDSRDNYKNYLLYDGASNLSNNLCYEGTVNWLFDSGYFAEKVQGNSNSTSEIKSKAAALKTSLSSAVVYSWRRGVYCSDNSGNECLGIAVCGGMIGKQIYNSKKRMYTLGIPTWYRTDLKFGRDSLGNSKTNGWAGMIAEWFGVGSSSVVCYFEE